jgi:hypothetical protein
MYMLCIGRCVCICVCICLPDLHIIDDRHSLTSTDIGEHNRMTEAPELRQQRHLCALPRQEQRLKAPEGAMISKFN